MKKSLVSPRDFTSATYSVQKLAPALEALAKIDRQSVGYDDGVFAKIQEFHEYLSGIHAKAKAIVDQGNSQYDNRPQELIGRASHRMLHEIPQLIQIENGSFDNRVRAHQFEVDELRKRGFNDSKIEKIIPSISQSEVDVHKAKLEELRAESKAIDAFLKDAPRYDVDLLKVSPIYPWPVGEAV